MSGSDWHDPFAEDPDAVERERRRAEREARRRARQQSLGEKVQTVDPPAVAAATRYPTTDGPAAERTPTDERTTVRPGAGVIDAGEQATTRPAPPAPATGESTALKPRMPPPPRAEKHALTTPALGPLRAPGSRGLSPKSVRNRRIVGVLVFFAVLGLLIFGVTRVIDRLGGSGDAPVAEPPPLKVENVTIPEGLDRHQIGDLAKKAKLRGDYEKASKNFKGFDLSKYGAGSAPNLEGFLFPATYELPKKGTAKDLVSRQLDAFEQNIKSVDMSYAESKNLNVYDVLKIASMIEREVQVPKERPLVAEVIYNRLAANNPLGIDATIRYEDHNYDQQLTESRLNTDTPYNTRTHAGLPPTPIGNPGRDSIGAAASPAKGNLFYFVVKPGTCGEHVFTSSEAEFEQAEAAYQQALQEQGGSPTSC